MNSQMILLFKVVFLTVMSEYQVPIFNLKLLYGIGMLNFEGTYVLQNYIIMRNGSLL